MSKGPNVVDRVVAYFEEHPYAELTTREICERWGTSATYTKRYMAEAVRRGSVQVAKRKRHNAPIYIRGNGMHVVDSRVRRNDGGRALVEVWK